MTIESEMLTDAGSYRLRVKEVPISVSYGVGSSTENSVKQWLTVLLNIIKDMEYNKPLSYFTLPGFILAVAGYTWALLFYGPFFIQAGT